MSLKVFWRIASWRDTATHLVDRGRVINRQAIQRRVETRLRQSSVRESPIMWCAY